MKKVLFVLMSVLCLGAVISLPVRADESVREAEVTELNQIMVAKEALEAKEMPDDKADTVITYESGVTVFVIGETADGWYKVSYQDKEGYVRKSALAVQKLDVEALDKELAEAAEEGRLIIEEVERYRTEAKRSRIWGIIIVLLVVGIFTTGIISTVKIEKEKKKDDDGSKAAAQKLQAAVASGTEESAEILDLDKED